MYKTYLVKYGEGREIFSYTRIQMNIDCCSSAVKILVDTTVGSSAVVARTRYRGCESSRMMCSIMFA